MVTAAVLSAFSRLASWLLGAVPTLPIPTYITGRGAGTLYDQIKGLVAGLSGITAWLPASAMLGAAALVAAAMLTAVGVRVARIVASFFTAGGGSAA